MHRYVFRHGAAQTLTDSTLSRKSGKVKKVDEPCKAFSTTGNSFQDPISARSAPDIRLAAGGQDGGRYGPQTWMLTFPRFLPQGTALPIQPRPHQGLCLQGLPPEGLVPPGRGLRPVTRIDVAANPPLPALCQRQLCQRQLSLYSLRRPCRCAGLPAVRAVRLLRERVALRGTARV